MKKLGKLLTTLLLVVVSLTAICAVTACDFDSSEETEYTIVFQDKDGAELKTVTVKEGVVPEYTDELPELPANTAEFTYSWKWDKEFLAATANATYKLVLDSVKNKYEIKFISDGEQVGATQTIEYGTAAIAPADPTKAGTEDESYVFDGWYTAAEGGDKVTDFTVKGAATYYARYNLVRNYTVKFVSEGVELQSSKVASGTIPEYKGATPTKQATAQFTYTFKGWDLNGKFVTSIDSSAFSKSVSALQQKAREQKYKNRLSKMESMTMVMLVCTGGGGMILLIVSMLMSFSSVA